VSNVLNKLEAEWTRMRDGVLMRTAYIYAFITHIIYLRLLIDDWEVLSLDQFAMTYVAIIMVMAVLYEIKEKSIREMIRHLAFAYLVFTWLHQGVLAKWFSQFPQGLIDFFFILLIGSITLGAVSTWCVMNKKKLLKISMTRKLVEFCEEYF